MTMWRRYHCMWLRESARHAQHAANATLAARPLKAIKYHGKWPFTRLLGMQVRDKLVKRLRYSRDFQNHLACSAQSFLQHPCPMVPHHCTTSETPPPHAKTYILSLPSKSLPTAQEPLSVALSAANFVAQAHCLLLFLRLLGVLPQRHGGPLARAGSGSNNTRCERPGSNTQSKP